MFLEACLHASNQQSLTFDKKEPPTQQCLKGRLRSGGSKNLYCTLISSTSKTRVEFGPMTGPAPRSP